MRTYDYLVVGSGITGSVFANQAAQKGKRCLVLEKRDHIGGNIYDFDQNGILVHRYGPHIFHTSSKEIWAYVNSFGRFNHFINSPVANYKGEIYNLPFNMNTFSKLWNISTPQQAIERIEKEKVSYSHPPRNLEEQALSLVGKDIYQKLIQGYTEKQWGRPCNELPAFIIKRLPLRFTYDNNYFNDIYQGIPEEGYTHVIKNMLNGCEVQTGVDYLKDRKRYDALARKTVYTGMIDQYFDYCLGYLEYRSIRFEDRRFAYSNYQGVAVMNFTDRDTPYTRRIEHKHFLFGKQADTLVTWEYPMEWTPGEEPYYPVNDDKNQRLFSQYQKLAKKEKKVRFCGRLAEYRYYDMDKAIASALKNAKQALEEDSD